MSDEFQQLEVQDELERLKTITPQWAEATPEPFLRSPQQDVTPPNWNKVNWNQSSGTSQNVQGATAPNLAFIAGQQMPNGSFEIKLISVNGNSTDPPV